MTRVEAEALIRRYLAEERWMEAMVVAQRSIAEFATPAVFRELLAQVYDAQGKSSKAAEARAGRLD